MRKFQDLEKIPSDYLGLSLSGSSFSLLLGHNWCKLILYAKQGL